MSYHNLCTTQYWGNQLLFINAIFYRNLSFQKADFVFSRSEKVSYCDLGKKVEINRLVWSLQLQPVSWQLLAAG